MSAGSRFSTGPSGLPARQQCRGIYMALCRPPQDRLSYGYFRQMLNGKCELLPAGANALQQGNLFADIPPIVPEEVFECLLETPAFRLERIISKAHVTPQGEWYDQAGSEWVVLLQGAALLRIEGRDDCVRLNPGDHVYLPAHCRHRVEWTDSSSITVWLALHEKAEVLGGSG